MYTEIATSYIIDWDLANQLLDVCFHQGRTDGNGGHHDWLNRMGWGFGHYHYHHGQAAHLHPDGKCPYGELRASIINPYTDKKIELGMPYYYEDNPYFSLNLVSKALTANDENGVDLTDKDTGGSFYACSDGNSSVDEDEKLGEQLFFTYPRGFFGIQNNTFFKTGSDELQLLCHNKKSGADNIECYAYVSLETIGEYMAKDGYFTGFSDNGSGVWSFEVRKPIVKIITPTNGDSFNVGDEIEVRASIQHVASARLIVGKMYPMGYIDGFQAYMYNLENQSTVNFGKFKLTEDVIGSAAIENGSLDIRVSGHTGGTAIDAVIDARTLGDAITVHLGNLNESANLEELFKTLDSYLQGNISDSEADKILREITENQILDTYKTSNPNDSNDYQRYDAYIIGWTMYHNESFFGNGSIQINPAIIKAMMWKESKMGYYSSSSPNANVSVDVLQTLDPRNPPVYEFSTYSLDTTKNVKILDGNGNYVLPVEIDPLYNYKKGRTTYETPVANRLFKKESDDFYYYQYQNASPLLSVALGIKEYAIKLNEANGNALIAAQNYNGSAHKVQYMNDVEALAFKGGHEKADEYN